MIRFLGRAPGSRVPSQSPLIGDGGAAAISAAALATVMLLAGHRAATPLMAALDEAASGLSALIVLPLVASLLPYSEDFVSRANRLRELRERRTEKLAAVTEPRWGLSLTGIGAVFFVPQIHVLKSYQKQRLTSFEHPEDDPQGTGYQVEQSKIAVGSGGLWGGKGSQTHGAFLPVPQTDFIFAAFAEEHGFVGALGVLLLYFIVLMRLTQNAQTAPDRAGTFVVMGVVAVLSFHILVNVGMVVGFMPVTGIPLPLMSYGGSSVLFMFLALGMVMNVRMRRFVN